MIEYIEDIKRASRKAAYDWPNCLTADDVTQELAMRLIEAPGAVERMRAVTDGERYKTLCFWANQIQSKERDALAVFNGRYKYSLDDIRDLLESGVLVDCDITPPSSWNTSDTPNGASYDMDPVTTAIAGQQDLFNGLKKLVYTNGDYYDIIMKRYVQGASLEPTERKRLGRAIEKLTTLMNRSKYSD